MDYYGPNLKRINIFMRGCYCCHSLRQTTQFPSTLTAIHIQNTFLLAVISLCEPNPCQNNRTCTLLPSSSSYTCDCGPGFTSERCKDGKITRATFNFQLYFIFTYFLYLKIGKKQKIQLEQEKVVQLSMELFLFLKTTTRKSRKNVLSLLTNCVKISRKKYFMTCTQILNVVITT